MCSVSARLRLSRCAATILLAATAAAVAAQPSDPRFALVPWPDYALASRPAPGEAGALRIEATARLAPRHELRLASTAVGSAGLDAWGLPAAALAVQPEPLRTTYRYTLFQDHDWAWKLGLTANTRTTLSALRLDRPAIDALPMVHMAGEGRFSDRWRVSFAADGLVTPRGRSLDFALQLDYRFTPNMSVFGGYRLSDGMSLIDDSLPAGLSNAARLGFRYRF